MAKPLRLRLACLAVFATGCALVSRAGPADERSKLGREIGDSLRVVLNAAVADKAFPGAYAVVGDSKGVLAEFGVGHLDWKPSPRPDRHTLWDLASLTKVIGTTTALAQLVEAGRVDVEAPVQRYVPDWTGLRQDEVTVRHLLAHTSGLPSFKPYDTLTHNPDSLSALLFHTGLDRAPGERMVYSDIGAFMMGQIIERVSGESLDHYIAAHITGPAGMRETMFNPPAAYIKRVAPTEIDTLRGGLVHGKVHDERAYYLGGVAAHAGLFSSAADLSRFATMLLRGGAIDSARILSAQTISRFAAYADSTRHNRALGWQKVSLPAMIEKPAPSQWGGTRLPTRSYGHTGFTGTSIAVDPTLDLYVILLSNRVNPTRANNKIGGVRMRLADAVVPVVQRERGLAISAERP